jgi:DNA-binding transcriptional regulator GbsR (MarR family)
MSVESTSSNGISQHPALVVVHQSMLDGLSQLADYLGFSKVMGQIYGALLLSSEALSLDDLMDQLSISKASVSMNIRTLEQFGMVRQVWLRGKSGRRKYYEAETDFIQIVTNILSGREMRDVGRALTVMDENLKLLTDARAQMEGEDCRRADVYLDRIQQMQTMFRFAQLVITSILTRVAEMKIEDISQIELR